MSVPVTNNSFYITAGRCALFTANNNFLKNKQWQIFPLTQNFDKQIWVAVGEWAKSPFVKALEIASEVSHSTREVKTMLSQVLGIRDWTLYITFVYKFEDVISKCQLYILQCEIMYFTIHIIINFSKPYLHLEPSFILGVFTSIKIATPLIWRFLYM